MSQAQFQKRQRERAKQEKAAAKRERRATRSEESAATGEQPLPVADAADVLGELEQLHRSFAAGTVEFDEFEQRKQALVAQLVP